MALRIAADGDAAAPIVGWLAMPKKTPLQSRSSSSARNQPFFSWKRAEPNLPVVQVDSGSGSGFSAGSTIDISMAPQTKQRITKRRAAPRMIAVALLGASGEA